MDATEKKAFVEWIEDNGDEGGKHEKEQRENDELEQENAELRRKKAAGKNDG